MSDRFAIIGAGPSGLAALKNFRAAGIDAVALEAAGDLGGNWRFGSPASSVYASTRLISSKRMTEYVDFPMPAEWPPYPSHAQALEYFERYADHFQLRPHIRFDARVEHVEHDGRGWRIRLAGDAAAESFAGLVIANGHHADPLWPELPGEFAGEIMHARAYKTPDVLAGRRVLVIGGGNTGCDLAVEAAQHARSACLSLRRGYHFLPKFLFGKPIDRLGDRLHRWRLPLAVRRWISSALVRIALGPPERYGLPRPDHRLFETHPIINSQLLYYVGHGAIGVRPAVERLDGDVVQFVDGRREAFDLIVCATGYQLRFPFFDDAQRTEYLNWRDGGPRLFLHALHPRRDDLFVAGMIQPNSGQWGLTDLQTRLMARYVATLQTAPERADWLRRWKAREEFDASGGIRFDASPRHALEVDYFAYRRQLERLLRRLPSDD